MGVVLDTAEVDDPICIYKTNFKNSHLKFLINSDTKRLEIVYGKILDKDIVFTNGFRVGLGKDKFFNKIFSHAVHLEKVNNVKSISTLEGISHTYHFERDTVSYIEMNTDYLVSEF